MDPYEIDLVRIEENINSLLYDPEISRYRSGLSDFVLQKLRLRVRAWLERFGITSDSEDEFLSDKPLGSTRLFQIVQQSREQLGLSNKMLSTFKLTAKLDRRGALAVLEDALLAKEMIAFRKEAAVSAKVWLNFIHCRNASGETTLNKIRSGLSLDEEDTLLFNSLVIHSVFYVDEAMRAEVRRLQKATGMTLTDFLIYSWISTDAWEAFYPVRKPANADAPDADRKKTSQETLLKLVIGFGLDEEGAKEFMLTSHSMFVFRRDLVVLSGIRCGYRTPALMQEILEFFAQGYNGQRYYSNLYSA